MSQTNTNTRKQTKNEAPQNKRGYSPKKGANKSKRPPREAPKPPRVAPTEVLFASIKAVIFYAHQYKSKKEELEKARAANPEVEEGASTLAERRTATYMVKSLNLLKQFAVERLVRDNKLHFEAFVVQNHKAGNKRYLLSRFVDSKGEQRFVIPAKAEDLALLDRAFTVETKPQHQFSLDQKPEIELEQAILDLSTYIRKDFKMLNGWRSSIWNAFNSEDMTDANGNETKPFRFVEKAMEELAKKKEEETEVAEETVLRRKFADESFEAPVFQRKRRHPFTIKQRK